MQVDTPSVSTANQANENVNVVNISHKEYHCNELQKSMDDTYLDRQTHKPLPNPFQKDSTSRRKRKHTVISQKSSQILKLWLFDHSKHPYPDDDEKDELCLRTNLTIPQLNHWFTNARQRILPPYLRKMAGVEHSCMLTVEPFSLL